MTSEHPRNATPGARRDVFEVLGALLVAAAVALLAFREFAIANGRVTVTLLVHPRGAAAQRQARAQRDARDDVAEIYGTPVGQPIELVIPGGSASPRLLVPAEAPDRRFLPVEALSDFRKPLTERLIGVEFGLGVAAAGLVSWRLGRARRRARGLRAHGPSARA